MIIEVLHIIEYFKFLKYSIWCIYCWKDSCARYWYLSICLFLDLENETPRPHVFKKKIAQDDEGKYETNCIRINNNVLQHLNGFAKAIQTCVINPDEICWLDLSQNELTNIDAVSRVCDYDPQFSHLYISLHCILCRKHLVWG